MKPITILSLIGLCSPLFLSAQSTTPTSTYIHCTKFFESKPMRDLPDYKPEAGATRKEAADRKRNLLRTKRAVPKEANDYSDPVRQTAYGTRIGSIAPIENFAGSTDSIWDPGDPNGAVDSTYYVQTLNVTYSVFDKHGNVILPAKDLGSLWSGDPQDGDPVVLYDKFADRWVITEFQVTNTPYQFCVAVSKTNDPTGAFYVWQFSMGNTDPDYPKYSIWNNGYYITYQAFGITNALSPQQVAWLDRGRMLKGSPSAGMVIANMPAQPSFAGDNNSLFAAPKILDCDASALPPYGEPDFLVFFQCIAAGGASNSIIMDSLVVDTTAKTFRIAEADSFAVNTFNDYFTGGSLSDISQPGALHGVDALDGTFNFRVPYMMFTGYNSVALSNTVNLGGMVAGIRWYELRQDAITKAWSLHQQGTYGPSDGVSRWNGAICEDYNGDIALAYSVADSVSVYPGIRYTGRLQSDPLGQMTFAEQTAIAGTTSLSGTGGRWGDYSELDIDPADGLTFWCTNQYNASNNNYTQQNRIFSFKLATSLGIQGIQNDATIKVYQTGNFLEVNAANLPSNDKVVVDLFDISGRQLTTQSVAPASNSFETKINVSTLPKGVYFVRIGRMGFQRVVKTVLN